MERKHARLFFLSEIFCVRLYMVLALSFDFRSGILVWQDCWLTFDGFELPWMHNSFLAASFDLQSKSKMCLLLPARCTHCYQDIRAFIRYYWICDFGENFVVENSTVIEFNPCTLCIVHVHTASPESFLFILLHHKSQHEFRMHCSFRMHWCASLVIISLRWLCFNSDFISFSNHLPIFISSMQLRICNATSTVLYCNAYTFRW